MPVYIKQSSAFDFAGANNLNPTPSLRNFAVSQRPYTAISTPPILDSEQQSLIISNGLNRPSESIVWSPMNDLTGTLQRSFSKPWECPLQTLPTLRRGVSGNLEMQAQDCHSNLLPMISPEAYSCQRPPTFNYVPTELNNQLKEANYQPVNFEMPQFNNTLSLRTCSGRPSACFNDDQLTKNNFQDSCNTDWRIASNSDQSRPRTTATLPYAPPSQFADTATTD